MKKSNLLFWITVVPAIIIVFLISCNPEEEGMPWDGYEVTKMNYGNPVGYNIPNSLSNVNTGDIYWFYIDAESDMTYSIRKNVIIVLPQSFAQFPASAEITGYKEDGIVFGEKKPGEGVYNDWITYYSPIDQKIYIQFKITSTAAGGGYLVFGYINE